MKQTLIPDCKDRDTTKMTRIILKAVDSDGVTSSYHRFASLDNAKLAFKAFTDDEQYQELNWYLIADAELVDWHFPLKVCRVSTTGMIEIDLENQRRVKGITQ